MVGVNESVAVKQSVMELSHKYSADCSSALYGVLVSLAFCQFVTFSLKMFRLPDALRCDAWKWRNICMSWIHAFICVCWIVWRYVYSWSKSKYFSSCYPHLLFSFFLCQGYELSGEIALKNNHYYLLNRL